MGPSMVTSVIVTCEVCLSASQNLVRGRHRPWKVTFLNRCYTYYDRASLKSDKIKGNRKICMFHAIPHLFAFPQRFPFVIRLLLQFLFILNSSIWAEKIPCQAHVTFFNGLRDFKCIILLLPITVFRNNCGFPN